jgi:hypothetical protein
MELKKSILKDIEAEKSVNTLQMMRNVLDGKPLKEKTTLQCESCEYTVRYEQRGNLLRHNRIKHSRKRMIIEHVKAKGLMSRHGPRAKQSKSVHVRAESTQIYEDALKQKQKIEAQFKLAKSKVTPNLKRCIIKISPAVVKTPENLEVTLDKINRAYIDKERGNELKLKAELVKHVERVQDEELAFVLNDGYEIDEGEFVDRIRLVKDPRGMGLEVSFLQTVVDAKRGTFVVEYDNVFVY